MHTTRWWFLGITLISIGAVCFAFNAAHRNRVLTTDSIIYVDTARHIAAGQGATTSILKVTDTEVPTPQTQWPPLYPMTMAPLIALGVDPILAGRIISALAFGLTALLVGVWVWRLSRPIVGIAAALLLTTLPGITSIAAAVWADSLYTFLVTLLAWLSYELIQNPNRKLGWFALGSLVGLSIVAKYLGILLIGVFVVVYILSLRRYGSMKTAVTRLGLSLLGIALFVGPLLAYSVINGRPIGGADRTLSSQTLGQALQDLWNTISRDFTATTLWAGLIALTAVSGLVLIQRRTFQTPADPVLPLIAITLTYCLGLVAARLLIDTDNIYTRFTMPVYPLVVVVSVILIARVATLYNKRILIITFGLIALGAATWSIKAYDFGAGAYTPTPSTRTQTVADVSTNRDLIIGNGSREYNLFLGRSVIHLSDDSQAPRLTRDLLDKLVQRWNNTFDRILVAVTPEVTAEAYGPLLAEAATQTPAGFEILKQTPTISIYQVR